MEKEYGPIIEEIVIMENGSREEDKDMVFI